MSVARSWGRVEVWPQIGLALATVALAAAGAGAVLNLAFLPLAAAVALFLYLRSPTKDYISFCLWIWMLSPLVRRLADWSNGFQEFSLIIIAPLAVSTLCLLRANRRLFWSYTPFVLFIVVYMYGAFVGAVQGQLLSASFAFVTAIVPVLFGCYVLTFPRDFAVISETMMRCLSFGSLVISIYAIDQYFNLRPWDAYWIVASGMNSIGAPLPQMFRLFGTLNSPGPFATFLQVGLLAMLSPSSTRLRFIAAPLALLALALTLVRSTWGGLAVGLLFLLVTGRGTRRFKYALVGAFVALLALPLLTLETVSDTVLTRLDTLVNITRDTSYSDRIGFSNSIIERVDTMMLGNGFGLSGLGVKFSGGSQDVVRDFDNGILELFYNFGFLAIVLISSLLFAIISNLRSAFKSAVASVEMAIAVSVLSLMIFSNQLGGFTGMLIFPFFAVVVSRRAAESGRVRTSSDMPVLAH